MVALWGIESNYGKNLGDFEVIDALATLVYNNFRAQFFRQQLIAALKILAQGHVSFDNMKGSWAGAMGQCQFIPTSFLAYAADGDGDGRMDIWTNKADVFASITQLPAARRLAARRVVGPGGAGRHAGGAGRAHRAAGRSGRPDLPHDGELPGHPALEPVGFLRARRRAAVRQDRCGQVRLPDPTKMMYDQAAMPLAVVSPRIGPMPVVRVLGTLLLLGCLAGLLGACGSSSRGGGAGVAQRGTYKVGAPYKIDGVTYTPHGRVQPDRDRRRLVVRAGLPRQVDGQRRAL